MKTPIKIRKTGQLNIHEGIKKISKVRNNSMKPSPSKTKPTKALPDF
jgi:hypothetical protein